MRPTLPPKHCTLPLQLHVCNYQVWFRVLGPYISISSVVVWCFFLTLQFFFFISPYISYHKIKLRLDDAFVVIYLTRPEKHFSRISNGSLLRRKKDVRTWITLSVSLSLSLIIHIFIQTIDTTNDWFKYLLSKLHKIWKTFLQKDNFFWFTYDKRMGGKQNIKFSHNL